MFLRWFSKTKSTSNVFPVHWAIRQSGDPNSLKNEKNQDIFFKIVQILISIYFFIIWHVRLQFNSSWCKMGLRLYIYHLTFWWRLLKIAISISWAKNHLEFFFLHFVQILPGPGGKVRISKLLSFPLEEVKVKPFLFCNSFNLSIPVHTKYGIYFIYIFDIYHISYNLYLIYII